MFSAASALSPAFPKACAPPAGLHVTARKVKRVIYSNRRLWTRVACKSEQASEGFAALLGYSTAWPQKVSQQQHEMHTYRNNSRPFVGCLSPSIKQHVCQLQSPAEVEASLTPSLEIFELSKVPMKIEKS